MNILKFNKIISDKYHSSEFEKSEENLTPTIRKRKNVNLEIKKILLTL
jgi:hypothetical protein